MQIGAQNIAINSTGALPNAAAIDITDAQQQIILHGVSWSGGVYMVVMEDDFGNRMSRKVVLRD